MFTRAGFIPRIRRTGIRARVAHLLYPGHHRAELVQLHCGDFAWYSRGRFMAWPHQVRVVNQFYFPRLALWGAVGRSSPIDGPRLKAVA